MHSLLLLHAPGARQCQSLNELRWQGRSVSMPQCGQGASQALLQLPRLRIDAIGIT